MKRKQREAAPCRMPEALPDLRQDPWLWFPVCRSLITPMSGILLEARAEAGTWNPSHAATAPATVAEQAKPLPDTGTPAGSPPGFAAMVFLAADL